MANESNERGDCPQRVAYDIMVKIAECDVKGQEEQVSDARAYYMKLYRQCLILVLRGEIRND